MMGTLATFGAADWAVVAAYWLAMIYIGVIAARKDQNTEEYFLGGRSLPTWALAMSIVVTSLSAATFLGAPDSAYLGDISYLILNLGGFIAVFVVAILFVPRLYRAGTVTIYGYLDQRFGPGARIAVSSTFLFGRMLASGARLFMAGIPLCLLMFGAKDPARWQLILAICLIGLIGTFYTTAGGIRAIVWIDVVQFFLVVGAVLVSIGLLLHKIPASVPQIAHALAQPGSGPAGSKLHLVDLSTDPARPYTLWAALFGALFLSMATYGVDHDFAQRFMVSKSVVRGGVSLILGQLLGVAVVVLFLAAGLLLWVYYRCPAVMGTALPPEAPTGGTQAAYPFFIVHELPTVVSGLAIAGFFAMAQGSMDSALNALASSLVADLYFPLRQRLGYAVNPKQSVRAPKITVAAVGVAMTLFAIGCSFAYDARSKTLLDFALGVMPFAWAGMLGVFLTALLTRRGNTWSVLAALATGAAGDGRDRGRDRAGAGPRGRQRARAGGCTRRAGGGGEPTGAGGAGRWAVGAGGIGTRRDAAGADRCAGGGAGGVSRGPATRPVALPGAGSRRRRRGAR
jgi:solute:Na+ symporter, SSS family